MPIMEQDSGMTNTDQAKWLLLADMSCATLKRSCVCVAGCLLRTSRATLLTWILCTLVRTTGWANLLSTRSSPGALYWRDADGVPGTTQVEDRATQVTGLSHRCTCLDLLQSRNSFLFVGALAKLRKASTASSCPSVCLSVCLSVRPSVRPPA